MSDLQDQAIRQHCKALRMPTIGTQFARLADAVTQEGQSHVGYLDASLTAEMEERESRAITRLLHEARLPRMKTLEAFEFDRSGVSAAQPVVGVQNFDTEGSYAVPIDLTAQESSPPHRRADSTR